jgi:hypothetical protein
MDELVSDLVGLPSESDGLWLEGINTMGCS